MKLVVITSSHWNLHIASVIRCQYSQNSTNLNGRFQHPSDNLSISHDKIIFFRSVPENIAQILDIVRACKAPLIFQVQIGQKVVTVFIVKIC